MDPVQNKNTKPLKFVNRNVYIKT